MLPTPPVAPVTSTGAFTLADIKKNAEGNALMIHAGPDNFGNIPSARYTNVVPGQPVPDELLDADQAARREQILTTALRAAAAEFAWELPDGVDTQIGEEGLSLSGGERQRVTLARAYLQNAPVLVLDEATAQVERVENFLTRALGVAGLAAGDAREQALTAELPAEFAAALDDDVNVSAALAVVFEQVRRGNSALAGTPDPAAAGQAAVTVAAMLEVLGEFSVADVVYDQQQRVDYQHCLHHLLKPNA